eukprot:gene6641-4760_t
MKLLQSSSRGSSGGRGRGRGRGGRTHGPIKEVPVPEGKGRRGGDQRFASRFTDPRFRVSQQLHKQKREGRGALEDELEAAKRDPRFAKHLQPEEEEVPSEAEEEEVEEEEPSEAEEEDVCQWAGAEPVELIEARRRVAVVNCNWDCVRAVDLYAILFHGLPLGGELLEVCVYKSEFGKRMMEHERIHGPDLWVKPGQKDPTAAAESEAQQQEQVLMESIQGVEALDGDEEADDEEADDEEADDGWVDDDPAMLREAGEDGERFSSGKFRQYEMNRMKYYYAIATFDSADTAQAVYRELDGMDIEASGVLLDLRYVDDDETFDKEDMVGRADRIPPNFKPLAALRNAALSQTRFRISWDQDDPARRHSVLDSFSGTAPEDDLAAYMAESEDEDDEAAAAKKRKIRRQYAALLEEIGADPDDVEEEEEEASAAASTSDDDDLNRLSDVELDDDASEGSPMDMEATLDLGATDKALELQREARTRRLLQSGDLLAKAEAKYKLRRKEAKQLKKEALRREREDEQAAQEAESELRRQQLRDLIGSDDAGAARVSGKERRKTHAKEVKAQRAAEREERKKMRAASRLGVDRQVRDAEVAAAAQTGEAIDPRFKSKLVSDPRFHLDVGQRDKKVGQDVAALAAQVSRAKRRRASGEVPGPHGGVDEAVEFFLQPAEKKRRV